MALTREGIISLIEDEIGYLPRKTLVRIANDYNEANSYPHWYENTQENLINILDNDLAKYFEYLRHSNETYSRKEDYFYINGNGWFTSFDYPEEEVDTKALAEFVYEHFDDYDSEFESTTNEIEEYEEWMKTKEDEDEDEDLE